MKVSKGVSKRRHTYVIKTPVFKFKFNAKELHDMNTDFEMLANSHLLSPALGGFSIAIRNLLSATSDLPHHD